MTEVVVNTSQKRCSEIFIMSERVYDCRVGLHVDLDGAEIAVDATISSFDVNHALDHAEKLLHSGCSR